MSETRYRTENLVIRLAPEERAELNALAAYDRRSASDVVRWLIRDAWRCLPRDAQSPTPDAEKPSPQ